jgi:iron complex transport system substrate-binding protein
MKYILVLLTILLCLSACSDEKKKLVEDAPIISTHFTDDKGTQINLNSLPEKVISLAPNITEMIYASSLPAITTYPNLDTEGLVAQKPDMVLVTDEIFSPDVTAHLQAQGLSVYTQSYKTLADIYRNIRQTGTLLDVETQANRIADSLENIEKKVWAETQKVVKYRTIILVSENPFIVVGGTGYLNELITKSGGENVYKDKKEPYTQTTLEEIVLSAPEYILLPTDDPQMYSKLTMKYPMLWNTPAADQKHVFQVPADVFFRPGVRTIAALLQTTNILHSQFTQDKFK